MDFLRNLSFWLLTSQMAVMLLITPKETFAGYHSDRGNQAEAESDRGAAEAEREAERARDAADIQEENSLLRTNPVADRAVERAVRNTEEYMRRETGRIILGTVIATAGSVIAMSSFPEYPVIGTIWAAATFYGVATALDGCRKSWQTRERQNKPSEPL